MTQKQKGFTLVELMVVLTIIVSVGGLMLLTLKNVQKNSRDRQRTGDLEAMRTALERYRDDDPNHKYPFDPAATCYCSDQNDALCSNNGGNWIPGLKPKYMSTLPKDPLGGDSYCASYKSSYVYCSDGNNYKLLSHCAPEGTWDANHPYYDPVRPTWAWVVCSTAATCAGW